MAGSAAALQSLEPLWGQGIERRFNVPVTAVMKNTSPQGFRVLFSQKPIDTRNNMT